MTYMAAIILDVAAAIDIRAYASMASSFDAARFIYFSRHILLHDLLIVII